MHRPFNHAHQPCQICNGIDSTDRCELYHLSFISQSNHTQRVPRSLKPLSSPHLHVTGYSIWPHRHLSAEISSALRVPTRCGLSLTQMHLGRLLPLVPHKHCVALASCTTSQVPPAGCRGPCASVLITDTCAWLALGHRPRPRTHWSQTSASWCARSGSTWHQPLSMWPMLAATL